MLRRRFPIALWFFGLGCLAVAIINRHHYPPSPRSIAPGQFGPGWTAYASLETPSTPSRFDPFDVWDPYLWTGVGVTLLLVGLCLLVVGPVRSRARPDELAL